MVSSGLDLSIENVTTQSCVWRMRIIQMRCKKSQCVTGYQIIADILLLRWLIARLNNLRDCLSTYDIPASTLSHLNSYVRVIEPLCLYDLSWWSVVLDSVFRRKSFCIDEWIRNEMQEISCFPMPCRKWTIIPACIPFITGNDARDLPAKIQFLLAKF